MCATLKPHLDIAKRIEVGGAAPAVITCTTRGRGRIFSCDGAFIMVLSTTGAAQKCVTPWLAMAK